MCWRMWDVGWSVRLNKVREGFIEKGTPEKTIKGECKPHRPGLVGGAVSTKALWQELPSVDGKWREASVYIGMSWDDGTAESEVAGPDPAEQVRDSTEEHMILSAVVSLMMT